MDVSNALATRFERSARAGERWMLNIFLRLHKTILFDECSRAFADELSEQFGRTQSGISIAFLCPKR